MCYRRARAGRAKQLGFPEHRALFGLGAVLATAAGAACLAGCSPGPSQTPEMSVVAARRVAPAPAVYPQELSAALLSPADMGSNFSALPKQAPAGSGTAPGSGPTSVTGCPQLGILGGVGVTTAPDDQGVAYQAADETPLVGESLRTAPAAVLAADYAEDRAALATCRQLHITVQGTGLDVTLTHVGLGRVKSAAAVRLDGMLEGVQIDGYLALDDVGPAELAFLFLQIGTASPQPAVYYFEHADAKARHYLDTVWSSWHGSPASEPGAAEPGAAEPEDSAPPAAAPPISPPSPPSAS
jgi:hypothetical protein